MERNHLEDIWCWTASSWHQTSRRMFSPGRGRGAGCLKKKRSCCYRPWVTEPEVAIASATFFFSISPPCLFPKQNFECCRNKIWSTGHNPVTHRVNSPLRILKGTRLVDCSGHCADCCACVGSGSHPSIPWGDWCTQRSSIWSGVTWLVTDGVGAVVSTSAAWGNHLEEFQKCWCLSSMPRDSDLIGHWDFWNLPR